MPESAPGSNPADPPALAASVEVPIKWLNEPLKYAYDAGKCAATVPCGEEPTFVSTSAGPWPCRPCDGKGIIRG